jgi:hypothetical protein
MPSTEFRPAHAKCAFDPPRKRLFLPVTKPTCKRVGFTLAFPKPDEHIFLPPLLRVARNRLTFQTAEERVSINLKCRTDL